MVMVMDMDMDIYRYKYIFIGIAPCLRCFVCKFILHTALARVTVKCSRLTGQIDMGLVVV